MEELSLFDFPQVEINKPIRLIELFGGIGSQAMALRDIGANFEHYRLVEFDKYAVASYNAIHGTNFTTTDIRDVHGVDMGIVNRQEFTYLLTYSFPCTDLSVAGKMQGMSKADWENGKSTRSGLLWEVERILKELKDDELPQILLMENVPQVHSEQNIADFESWLNFLRSRGYYNFYQDLNAKNYGIPQKRERCFCVSILADEFVDYEFPSPIPLTTEMKDYLDDTVDEKYYINTGKAKALIRNLLTNNQENQICVQINYNNVGKIGCKVAKALDTRCKEFNTGFQLKNGVVETIDLSLKKPKKIKMANCISARNDRSISNLKGEGSGVIESWCVAMRGRNPEHPTDRTPGIHTEQRLEMNKEGLVNTLTTVQKDNLVLEQNEFFNQAIKTAEEGNAEPGDIIDAFNKKVIKTGISPTITTRPEGKKTAILPCVEIKKVGQISNDGSQYGTVISDDGLCSTLTAGTHGYANNCISVKQATKEGSIKCKVGGCYDASYPDSKTRRGRVQDNGDTVPTLTASSSENINYVETVYRIRKLTPLECGRLMGYCDFDIEKTLSVNSNSQVYRQFGNAIVKQVLMAIFLQLGIEGLKKWNDRTPEEREKLVMGSVYDKEFE